MPSKSKHWDENKFVNKSESFGFYNVENRKYHIKTWIDDMAPLKG